LTDGAPERGATAPLRGCARRTVAEPALFGVPPVVLAGVPLAVLVRGVAPGVGAVVGTARRTVDVPAGRRVAPFTVGDVVGRERTVAAPVPPRGTAARVVARTGAEEPVDGTEAGLASALRGTARRVSGTRLPGCRARRFPEIRALEA
jgi:hypothetical protein